MKAILILTTILLAQSVFGEVYEGSHYVSYAENINALISGYEEADFVVTIDEEREILFMVMWKGGSWGGVKAYYDKMAMSISAVGSVVGSFTQNNNFVVIVQGKNLYFIKDDAAEAFTSEVESMSARERNEWIGSNVKVMPRDV